MDMECEPHTNIGYKIIYSLTKNLDTSWLCEHVTPSYYAINYITYYKSK